MQAARKPTAARTCRLPYSSPRLLLSLSSSDPCVERLTGGDAKLEVVAHLGGRPDGDDGVEEVAAEERHRDTGRVGGRREHIHDELEQRAVGRAIPRRRDDLSSTYATAATTAGSV